MIEIDVSFDLGTYPIDALKAGAELWRQYEGGETPVGVATLYGAFLALCDTHGIPEERAPDLLAAAWVYGHFDPRRVGEIVENFEHFQGQIDG